MRIPHNSSLMIVSSKNDEVFREGIKEGMIANNIQLNEWVKNFMEVTLTL